MSGEAKDVVRALVDAVNRQDWNRVRQLITPDFGYTVQAHHLPGGGTPMDGDTMLAVLPGVFTLFDEVGPQMELTHLVADGAWVAVEALGSGHFRDGSRYDNRYASMYEVVRGRVRTIREYTDTEHMARLFAAATAAP